MDKIFAFARKRQVAPFFLIVTVVATIAFAWACKINYGTTYGQLGKIMPREAAVMFTLVVQSFEFLIPTISVLGIMHALELSPGVQLGTYIGWFAVIAVDFLTAYQYFIGYYDHPNVGNYFLSGVLSAIFLVAELFLMLSVVATYCLYKIWTTGTMPDWIMNPQASPRPNRPVKRSVPLQTSMSTRAPDLPADPGFTIRRIHRPIASAPGTYLVEGQDGKNYTAREDDPRIQACVKTFRKLQATA